MKLKQHYLVQVVDMYTVFYWLAHFVIKLFFSAYMTDGEGLLERQSLTIAIILMALQASP